MDTDFPIEGARHKVGLILDPGNYRSAIWEAALGRSSFNYTRVDIHAPNWHKDVTNSSVDFFVSIIPANVLERYLSYISRASAIEQYLSIPVYPSPLARSLYENKQAMADFLQCNGYPFAPTHAFTDRASAISFSETCSLPIVLKSNFGSGSTGVEIIRSRSRLLRLVKRHFSRVHPYFAKGYAKPMRTRRFPLALPVPGRLQRNFVLLQEYVEARWEWRVVRIGSRYFSHKKLMVGEYASGTLAKAWDVAPPELFDLVKSICEKHDFPVMCVDVLETSDGRFIVNELQCQFGQSTQALMLRDGVPGYMSHTNQGEWKFCDEEVAGDKSADIILAAYAEHFFSRPGRPRTKKKLPAEVADQSAAEHE